MEENFFPEVASFLLRIVQDQRPSEEAGGFRGLIRHIQTDEELNFSCWAEVQSFVQAKFPIEEKNQNKGDNNETEG